MVDFKKEAHKRAVQRWRLKNPDKVLAMRRRYRLKNRIAIREADHKYRLEHLNKRREASLVSYFKHHKKRRMSQSEYGKKHRDEHRERYAEKNRVRNIVNGAIRYGKLKRQPCWCGEVGQAHHTDYTKPYQVVWLCRKHHAECHRKY